MAFTDRVFHEHRNASSNCYPTEDVFSSVTSQETGWSSDLDPGVITALAAYSILVAVAIYYKCQAVVRISFTVCVLCWMTRLMPSYDEEVVGDVLCSQNLDSCKSRVRSSLCLLWSNLFRSQDLSYVFYVTFAASLSAAFWGTEKPSIVKDMTSTGFEYFVPSVRTREKTTQDPIPQVFRRRDIGKVPPVFPNGWIPVVESRDIPLEESRSVFALGRHFAVFRGQDGKVYILDAFCPHLGANLAVGGKVEGKCLKCPFHGWKFDGENGMCTSIPYAKRVPDVAKTKSWTCCEENGFIYLWHHAEGYPPIWEIPKIDEVANKKWTYRGRTEHIVRCHIQEIPENGADVAHLHELHSPSVFTGKALSNFMFNWAFMKHDWLPKWEPCTEEGNEHMARVTLNHHIRIFNLKVPFTSLALDIRQVGPASVQMHMKSSFGRGVLLQNIVPEGPLQNRIVQQLYSERLFFGQWVADMMIRGEAIMLERDITIWNHKKFIKNPLLVKEDKLISRYRRWYSQFYSENSPTLRDVQEKTLEW